jgi:Polyketide cyclase / dehydrase and lipid transport
MWWVVWIVVAILTSVGAVALIGSRLPRGHQMTRTTRLKLPPDALFAILVDVDNYRTWRPDVRNVQRLPDCDGRPAWVEEMSAGRIPMFFEGMERPSLLVGRIADSRLPFGGSWTYRIAAADEGSELSITEHGEVYNPIFRFMSRFVFGHTATMDTFIKHLQAKVALGGSQ